MVNIEKYKNDGWGLSKKCFFDIEKLLKNFNEPTIIEFGSGVSTIFLTDYLNENNKNGKIYSFDNEIEFLPKVNDSKLELKVTNLLSCNDIDFENMFLNRKYSRDVMRYRFDKPNSRQRNCFYDLTYEDLPKECDLCIIDGPHGNGRSIAFLHLINRLKSGSFVIIDDYTHYDFSEKFKIIFPNSELVIENTKGRDNQWENGGDYRIFKIT
jgi:hypothetical protein